MVDSGLELWCKKPHLPYMFLWFFKDWDSQLSFFGMEFTSHEDSILKTEWGFQKSKPKLLLPHAEIEEELHKFFTFVENLWQINQCLSLQECYNFWEILKISQNMREKRIPFADTPQRPNRIFAYTRTPQGKYFYYSIVRWILYFKCPNFIRTEDRHWITWWSG